MSDTIESQSQPETRLLVSLATYNEAGNLQPLVQTIRQFAPRSSILIIDDNSPDGTGKIADELAVELPAIHVMHRPGKLGVGTAMLEAISFAVGNQYDYLLNLDADFSHPPRFIPALLDGMRDHDVMIGSRYVPGGGVEGGFTFKRKFIELRHQLVRTGLAGPHQQGQQRGLSLLPRQQARPDRPEQGSLAGIFLPGGDPLLVQASGLPDRGDSNPVREPAVRRVEDQHRRGRLGIWILLLLGLGRVRG